MGQYSREAGYILTVLIYITSMRIMIQTKIFGSRERSFLMVIGNKNHKRIFCRSRKTSVCWNKRFYKRVEKMKHIYCLIYSFLKSKSYIRTLYTVLWYVWKLWKSYPYPLILDSSFITNSSRIILYVNDLTIWPSGNLIDPPGMPAHDTCDFSFSRTQAHHEGYWAAVFIIDQF